ncbi:glutathione S-transferase [Jannaschia sp. KMU-145]|uniref:glutathione S-transferase n=1 Tax=Jannaschia halovivens TaxID=3388667 RepID=UPI00396B1C37
MTHQILIGDRAYSSWSLRGWLLFHAFGLPVEEHRTQMYSDDFARDLEAWAPARTVPTVRTPEGGILSDSLAIAEYLAETYPEAGHWPREAKARALARSIAAEMHSGFTALRGACPMNLRVKWEGFEASEAVAADLARLSRLWTLARGMAGDGPWLFGAYGAVDAFMAPVAMRIAGYGLATDDVMAPYIDAHLNHLPLRRWRAMGEARNRTLHEYDMDLATGRFPMPRPIAAEAVAIGPSVNATCPYSGLPVTDFLKVDGRIWGFCNTFCRDKTIHDPEAWPAFMALIDGPA